MNATQNKLVAGNTVTLLSGYSNPQPVVWTIEKVTRTSVYLVCEGRFRQKVARELVAVKLAK